MQLSQPVLLQSFSDEFDLPKGGKKENVPAIPGTMLVIEEDEPGLSEEEMTTYRSGVGKMLHMMRWSRPTILNAVRELSRWLQKCTKESTAAMLKVMKYCVDTPDRGLFLNPDTFWDGSQDFEFTITGKSDSEFARDKITRRTVGGHVVYLNGAPVAIVSKMQSIVALSVTESE